MIRVEPKQSWHIKCRRQAVATSTNDFFKPPVRVLGSAKAGKHAHCPKFGTIHRGVWSARVRIHAGLLCIIWSVHRIERNSGHRGEGFVANLARGKRCFPFFARIHFCCHLRFLTFCCDQESPKQLERLHLQQASSRGHRQEMVSRHKQLRWRPR